jgi:alkanesulfonate monooxygenase SsuD/methylene tetrahydromethanopterin reductase-like flavin-dependent oxidoreductase (luciferase family)
LIKRLLGKVTVMRQSESGGEAGGLRLAMSIVPTTVDQAKVVARAVEEAGFWGLGLGDSPAHFAELAVSLTSSLGCTEHLAIGSMVTNPRTRHWSVLAAMARALLEVAPGRFFLGISSGNSAVRAADGSPVQPTELRQTISSIRARCTDAFPILVAADGRRTAAAAGAVADGMVVGTGVDAGAFEELRRSADEERPVDGNRFDHWLYLHLNMVESERALDRARAESVSMAVSFAHRAFAHTLDGKHVPAEFAEILCQRLAGYDMSAHARPDPASPNAGMFRDRPEVEQYLLDRFTIYGTADMCRRQLLEAVEQTKTRRIWLSTISNDPVANVEQAGEAFDLFKEVA